jgi:stearoyl-CoA 9-desaturase NADPH oxidoreductase
MNTIYSRQFRQIKTNFVALKKVIKIMYRQFSYMLTNCDSLGIYFEPLIQPLLPMWSATECRAKIIKIDKQSNNILTLTLKPNRRWKGFNPGQYVELTFEKNGKRTCRSYYIASTTSQFETNSTIDLIIQVQPTGQISTWLETGLREGQVLSLSQAKGDFILQNLEPPTLLIASNIGIIAVQSLLYQLVKNKSCNIVLLYLNDDSDLFIDRLQGIEQCYSGVKIELIDTARIDSFSKTTVETLCPDYQKRKIYLCGPINHIKPVQMVLKQLSVGSNNIHLEHFYYDFNTTLINKNKGGTVYFKNHEKKASSKKEDTILSLARRNGIKPKYGCCMGDCKLCTCQKESGIVYNIKTGKYSGAGQELINICITRPVGDVSVKL